MFSSLAIKKELTANTPAPTKMGTAPASSPLQAAPSVVYTVATTSAPTAALTTTLTTTLASTAISTEEKTTKLAKKLIDGFHLSVPVPIDAKLILGDVIGCGGFAQVFKAKYQGVTIAVKQLIDFREGVIDEFRIEAAKMLVFQEKSLSCFVGYLAYYEDVNANQYQILMEYIEGETLHDIAMKYYESNNNNVEYARIRKPIPLLESVAILVALTEAEVELETKGIAHCDLKPANLILTPKGKIKMVDGCFSVCVGRSGSVRLGYFRGSLPYASPETLMYNDFSVKTDVWAVGSIVSIFANESEPFFDKPWFTITRFASEVAIKKTRHPLSSSCHPVFREAIQSCWDKEPSKRPTMKALHAEFSALYESEKRRLK